MGYVAGNQEYYVDGSVLTAARLEVGKSIDEVVKDIGCNKGTLSRWERGISRPREECILRLIMVYGRFDFVRKVEGGKNGE